MKKVKLGKDIHITNFIKFQPLLVIFLNIAFLLKSNQTFGTNIPNGKILNNSDYPYFRQHIKIIFICNPIFMLNLKQFCQKYNNFKGYPLHIKLKNLESVLRINM